MSAKAFQSIEVKVPDTNTFDLSHDNKLSLDMSYLTPVLLMETIPGDRFKITAEALVRFAPMTFPVMHVINVFIHFFYVPARIVWENFPKFIVGESIAHQYIQGTDTRTLEVSTGDILDYLGLPSVTNIKVPISPIPITAYYAVCNQYYQDQNNDPFYLITRDMLERVKAKDGLLLPTDFFSATDAAYQFGLIQRAWEHDYFTSALPFAQKGPAVAIPITLNDLPVEIFNAKQLDGTDLPVKDLLGADGLNSGLLYQDGTPQTAAKLIGLTDSSGASIEGDINQLRVSYALQRYYELNARGGTRYNENIKARWGVDIGMNEISKPQYIGGVKNNIVISEVLQTSATSGSNALGEYAGHGTGVLSGNTMDYYCPEQGYIIGLMSVIPKTAYFQGIPKHWTRMEATDYYTPEFAHIGEQAVLNKELYYDPALTDNNDEFGYQAMGAELKYIPSGVHGQFRTTFLDFTLARNFASRPVLNNEFVYCNDDKRIFAVQDPDVQSLYAHVYFNIEGRRKIPFYSTPI